MLGSLLLSTGLIFTAADSTLALNSAVGFVRECTPRDAGTIRGRIAANWILDHASAAGGNVRLDRFEAKTPVGVRNLTNIEAEFRGTDPAAPWTIVLSHYDTKAGSKCPGANDGASTTGLLIALCSTLSRSPKLAGNVLLLWTDGEECMRAYDEHDGLHGSRHAAAKFLAQGRTIRAVICVDMLGDRDLSISIPKNCSPELRALAHQAAERTGLKKLVRDIPELVKDDHLPFLRAGFPALDLIDFAYGSKPGLNDYWHTPADTEDKLAAESLLASGRLLCAMLELLP